MRQRPLKNKIRQRRRGPHRGPRGGKRCESPHREPDTRAEKRLHKRQQRLEGRRPGTGRRQEHLEVRRAQQLEGAAQGRKGRKGRRIRQEWKGSLGEALLAAAGHGRIALLSM